MAKIKLAILRFLCCGEIMKTLYTNRKWLFSSYSFLHLTVPERWKKEEFLNNIVRLILFTNNDQEFSLNIFTEFAEFSEFIDKTYLYFKKIWILELLIK